MFAGFIISWLASPDTRKHADPLEEGPNKRGVRTPDQTRLAMHSEEEEKALTGPDLTWPDLT
jgi:hypothetical protein